jgi:hypothetical protein
VKSSVSVDAALAREMFEHGAPDPEECTEQHTVLDLTRLIFPFLLELGHIGNWRGEIPG